MTTKVNTKCDASNPVYRQIELARREEAIKQSSRLAELRSDIAAMDPKVASAVKDNYYAAACALRELVRVLETVDAELLEKHEDPSAGYGSYALISEVLELSSALELVNRSYLGRVL
ncbi:MAG: hypothetical protein ACK496_04515 [Acidobacteriota bacterium]